MSPRLDLMMGYNYGKSPMGPEDIGDNPGINGIIEHHLSAGVGYQVSKHGTLALSYMRAFENELIGIRTGSTEQVKSEFSANVVAFQFTYRH
jgi:long-chain fatty acid transport protein